MDDLSVRFADALDAFAGKVRSLTVDRVGRWIRLSSLGMAALTLGLMATVFLALAIFGALAIPLGNDGAFGLLGLIALIGGGWMWTRRRKIS
jgi:LPXTG-motif cell wall-anchored protein